VTARRRPAPDPGIFYADFGRWCDQIRVGNPGIPSRSLDTLALTPLHLYPDLMAQRSTAPKTTDTATNSATAAAAVDPYVARVSAQVSAELARRVDTLRANGHAPEQLGDADTLAARMLAAVPRPSPWAELGPFYSTAGIARVLGGVSRQAVEERRRRRTILALRTADGVWVYPAFQLDERNRVTRGLAEVLDRFRPQTPDDEWMVAAFVAAAQPGLDGRTIVDHLQDGGGLAPVLDVADERAARWAVAS
jgi:hypothetical protein